MEIWSINNPEGNFYTVGMALRPRVLEETLRSPELSQTLVSPGPHLQQTGSDRGNDRQSLHSPTGGEKVVGTFKLRREEEIIRSDMGSTKTQSNSQVPVVSTLQISSKTT